MEKDDLLPRERGRTPLAKGKEQEKMVQSHQDKRTCRRFKVSVGIAGKNRSSIEGLLGKATAATGSLSNSPGKGNDVKGKGGGKKGKAKDAGALVWNQQAESPVASSVASSAPQTETTTTVGTIDTIECTALDLCATTMAQQEVVNPSLDSLQCGHWNWRNCVADECGLRM